MKKKYLILLIIAFAFQASRSMGQETMMDAVSNVMLEKMIITAKENYPHNKGLQAQINMAKSSLISQKSAWADGLAFAYNYNPNNTLDVIRPNFFKGYSVSINFSVTELFQKSSNVRQAKEAVKVAQSQLEEYNYTIEAMVKQRYYAFIQRSQLLKLQTKNLSDVQNMTKDAISKYTKGEVTFDLYNQSQISLYGAMQSKISAEADYLTAKSALEELLTKKVEEVQ
jgi:outer membrane protein TolC